MLDTVVNNKLLQENTRKKLFCKKKFLGNLLPKLLQFCIFSVFYTSAFYTSYHKLLYISNFLSVNYMQIL